MVVSIKVKKSLDDKFIGYGLNTISARIKIPKSLKHWLRSPIRQKTKSLILDLVNQSDAANQSIDFVIYWGFGEKQEADDSEIESKRILMSFITTFREVFKIQSIPKLNLILTDTHAKINQVPLGSRYTYQKSIVRLFSDIDCELLLMSKLVAGLENVDGISIPETHELTIDYEWKRMHRLLIKMARRHYLGRDARYDLAAKNYLIANLLEARVVGKVFPNSIHITFHSEDLDPLMLPSGRPIIHIYPSYNRTHGAPWFSRKAR